MQGKPSQSWQKDTIELIFISEAEVCGGVRRSCFLRSEQHEDPSKAGVRVSVQGLVLEQVSA